MKQMRQREMALADLAPAEYSPRTISDRARAGLAASIARFGLVAPIVWNERTGNVVSGAQRLAILSEAGETTTQVVDYAPGGVASFCTPPTPALLAFPVLTLAFVAPILAAGFTGLSLLFAPSLAWACTAVSTGRGILLFLLLLLLL